MKVSNRITITIIGHDIQIITNDGILIKSSDLDEEVYEISQSILDGYDWDNIFVESRKLMCFWSIVG